MDNSSVDIEGQEVVDSDISFVGTVNKNGKQYKNKKNSKKKTQNIEIPVIDIHKDGSRSSTPSDIIVEDEISNKQKIEYEYSCEDTRDDLNYSEKAVLTETSTDTKKKDCISKVDTKERNMNNRLQESIEESQNNETNKLDKKNFRDLSYIDEDRNKKGLPAIEPQFLLANSNEEVYKKITDDAVNFEIKNDEIVKTSTATVEQELKNDRDFICRLFPHLAPDDIETSLTDNFYHPERRAHVLKAYIEKCTDSNELLPDDVFFAALNKLRAAKKRSQLDANETNIKKIKYKHKLPIPSYNEYYKYSNNYLYISNFQFGSFPPFHSTIETENKVDNLNNETSVQVEENVTADTKAAAISANPPDKRVQWIEEKTNFLCEILLNIDRDTIYQNVSMCVTEDDVQLLLVRLMEQNGIDGSLLTPPPTPVLQNFPQRVVPPPDVPPSFNAEKRIQAQVGIYGSLLSPPPTPVLQYFPQRVVPPPAVPSFNAPPVGGAEPFPGPSDEGRTTELDAEERIQLQVAHLSEMFTDADPDYLHKRCSGIVDLSNNLNFLTYNLYSETDPHNIQLSNKENIKSSHINSMFQKLVAELLENPDYPKMEEYLKRQKEKEMRKKFIEGMSVKEFLDYFKDPEKVFGDTSKSKANDFLYIENAKEQLLRDFPHISTKDIDDEFRKQNYHYMPALKALQNNTMLKKLIKTRKTVNKQSVLDDYFIKEVCFVKMEPKIKHYRLKEKDLKKRDKWLEFLQAKNEGLLKKCERCYDDEVLEVDTSSCEAENGHTFCNNCVRRYAEDEIWQGKTHFFCLDRDCKAEFSLSILKKLMTPSLFSNLLQRRENLLFNLPADWEEMQPDKENVRMVTLSPQSSEYQCVLGLLAGDSNIVINVIKIERIQNPFLFYAFQNKVREMKTIYKGDMGEVNVCQLFHGTRSEVISNICAENFDWRLHGTSSGQRYGRGTYFSPDFSLSYRYCVPDFQGKRYMFVANVAVGAITKGSPIMTRPPINKSTGRPFDSTVDSRRNPIKIVKYDKQEYYPQYIITLS